MKSLLRFIACGSVDDGKSTLIGHMLYDAKLIFTDQVKALELDSLAGSRGGELDYSLLLDGLIAEREQGITIDVAYRYFSTTKRSFIVADTPGHEQYTRNMAVGASFADLAILLVDATQGVLRQTRRHAFICSMMGIRHFVVAVNKMDLVGYDQTIFDAIRTDITELMSAHPIETLTIIPVSATLGHNVTVASDKMPWYKGPALLAYLEEVEVQKQQATSFVMPIQRVSRPDHTFRGFQGQIESGEIKTGEDITVLPTREKARIKSILLGTHLVTSAQSGQAVTVTLDREVDVSRGCVLTQDPTLGSASVLSVTLLWMDEHDLLPGRNYLIKIGTKTLPGTVTAIHDKIDIETGTRVSARHLSKNEIGSVELRLSEAAVFEAFTRLKGLGSLIMIDRITHATSACGTVVSSLKLQEELHWQKTDINKTIRANQLNQTPFTLWFTGLSGSGKSTLANELEKRLVALGKHTMLLDGDNIRMGLNKNLGFTETDRIENIRRVAEVAKLMNDAGLIVLTSFISPYEEDRMSARSIIGGDYLEIYVSTDLKTCEARDPKGLYRKARAGQIENFTGISSPYEIPANPDLTVDAGLFSVVECADQVMSLIREKL